MRNVQKRDLRYLGRFVCIIFPTLIGAFLMKGDRAEVLPNTWAASVGPMSVARHGACAVPLADGRVLIAGGSDSGGALRSAEVFTSGRFRAVPSMATAHGTPVCAALPDGTVLVAGGRDAGGFTNATEIFDAAGGSWRSGPPLAEARAGASESVLPDGRVLIAGGETAGGVSDSLEIYDPASAAFAAVPVRMSSPRTRHAAAVLPDGRVLIAGGFDGSKALDSSEIFDPVTGQITPAGKLSVARAGLTATTLLDSRILVAGGANDHGEQGSVELFDPQTGTWTAEAARMLTPREGHAAILIPHNNTVLFTGGTAANQPLSQSEIYIPWRHEFRAVGGLDAAKTAAAVFPLANAAKVISAGGRDSAGPRSGAETFSAPAILTDRPNYHPGDAVQLSGSGWAADQAVEIGGLEASGATLVTADHSGRWAASWIAPAAGNLGVTFYPTATQEHAAGSAKSAVLTAQAAATSSSAGMTVAYCSGGGGSASLSLGTPLCVTVSGLSAQTSAEQIAWASPARTTYVRNVLVAAGQGQDNETPNAGGSWTVAAYPSGSCVTSGTTAVCAGTPDASTTITLGSGKLAFTNIAPGFPSGGCSPGLALQIQTNNGTAVNTTFPAAATLTSSNSSGQFFNTSNCTGSISGITTGTGGSSPRFYYSDTASSAKLTASAPGLNSATQPASTFMNPPSLAIAFGAPTIPLNGSTTLSFTVTNPSSNFVALAAMGVTDTMPTGLSVQTSSGVTGSCGGGTISLAVDSIVLSGASLAQGTSCTFSATVVGTAAGSLTDSAIVKSLNAGTGKPAAASLYVAAAPSITETFGAASVPLHGSTSLSFTITNPSTSTTALSGVGFSDVLPAGLAVATPNGLTGTCGGGTIAAAAGAGTVSLSGATLAAKASCTFAVNVTGTAAGALTNNVTVSFGGTGTGNTASAALSVVAPPSIAAAFGGATVPLGGGTALTFTITNPNASVSLSGVAVSGTLPAGVSVAATPGVTNSCGGTVTAVGSSIALTGGSLPQNGSCSIVVNVTATAAGALTDSVQVTSANGGTGNTATANLSIQTAATHFAVTAPATATAGTSVNFTVSALDSTNHIVTSYAGTVQFGSSDAHAVLPASSTLSNGTATFAANLKTAGTVTLTATDSASSSISGSASVAVSAAAAASIAATGGTPQSTTVGLPFAAPLQAVVKDTFGNLVSGATVTFQVPGTGASAVLQNTATTNSSGLASVSATANLTSGGYTVSVSIASATAAFVLTNLAAAPPPLSQSLQLNGTVAGTYSVPNSAPYSTMGSFYIDLRISNWGRVSGTCMPLVQFVTSAQYGPSRIQLCDPSYGWGAISIGEYIDGTQGGTPIWMQAPNLSIVSATATNPVKITLAGTPFPGVMSAGRTITIANAAGNGCSGLNGNQTIAAVSGNTLTLQYDGTACSYSANSGIALSQDFVFRFHRDLSLNQLIGEMWNVDGTGHKSQALGIVNSAPIALPGTFQIGSNGVSANLAFLRWYSGTVPVGAAAPSGTSGGDLADWEFDGNGNDRSGHNLNISFAGAARYVNSLSYPPACNAGVSQSFRAGQSAMLDGSGSFSMDGSTLSYAWSQIPSTLPGVPLQNLNWSSTSAMQPSITGLTFGPANFQLTVTQGDGQSTSCAVHDGAVMTDGNGVIINNTGSASLDSAVNTLIGPQVQLGTNPWPYYDQAATADAAIQTADMDVDYVDYWDTPGPGTVSVATNSYTVTGVGTTFTTTFCQGPGNPTAPQGGASIIVWYNTGRMVNGVAETGRRRMDVHSCASDTQLTASLPSNGTGWTSDAQAGSSLSYTAEFYNHMWEYGAAPANYYDNVQAYYALYYRSGIDTYLAAARKLADRFWTSPEIDRGMAFNVGDWFGGQNGRSNAISGIVLRALDTFDGHPDMWPGLHNVWSYTDWLLTTAYPIWSTNSGVDAREEGYTLAQAAYGALWDPDPTWQAYCRSMIEASFQQGASGVWPKNLDSAQQGWLQWFQMKATFDSGQPWSGSTVTLNNGSNVVTCTSGNCGWQASDFAAYDVNSGSSCGASGGTCGTVPVLFTDSATFPADSSHTDAVSYCYPNGCTFVDSNHFTLDRPYTGTSGVHGWVFGVSGGSLGGTVSGVAGWGGLPYMEGILGWAFDLAGKAMACNPQGGPSVCDNTTSALAYSYSAQAANWITTYGSMPSSSGISYFAGFPACGTAVGMGNLWCARAYSTVQTRELMGDAYRGLAAAYRHSQSPALKTTLDNWFSGMWAKPGTNATMASPDGQYDNAFDPTGCPGCGFFLTDGAPYSQKFFGQHFGISNEGGWPAIRLGY